MFWSDKCNLVACAVLRHARHQKNFKISHSLAASQWLSFQQQDSNNQALRTPNLAAGAGSSGRAV